MLYLFFIILVIIIAVGAGARYHTQVNAHLNKLLGRGDALPPEFELWLTQHKGEYDSLGKAMGAWADAKFGNKYNNLLQ